MQAGALAKRFSWMETTAKFDCRARIAGNLV